MIKSKRMKCAEDISHMGEMGTEHEILLRNLKGRDHFRVLCVDERIILK
jgi:hypothetical protein